MRDRVFAVLLGVWLFISLAPASCQAEEFRRLPLRVERGGKAGFTLLKPESTGILFANTLPEERYRTNQMLLNGSGVAAGDVDGDGLTDIYLCALTGSNVLYRNLGGWKFQDVTAQAGVALPDSHSSGAALVDLDGDGDLDLVVNTVGHGLHIFLNDGKGRFQAAITASPLNLNKGGTSLAFGDLDGDGWLDIYACNYRAGALVDMPNTRFFYKMINGKQTVVTVNGRPVSDPEFADRFLVTARGGIEEQGEADVILRNAQGKGWLSLSFTNGNFLDESGTPLNRPPFDWGLSATIRDINQDGLPDIFVCNDFNTPDRMWLNQGGGKFRAAPRLTMRKGTMFSMGVDFADIDRDGRDDFMLADMLSRDRVIRLTTMGDRNPAVTAIGQCDNRPEYMMNTLFINRGDGTYAETAQFSGVAASEWSWAVIFLDVDLDGWEDVLISNGFERAARNMDISEKLRQMRTEKQMSPAEILASRKIFPRLATPNVAFRNRGDLTFEDAGQQWGFDTVGVSHGMALADLDNDGDMDVIVSHLNAPVGIYRNDSAAPRLAVRLKGLAPNRYGIGARIQVTGGPVPQSQEMAAGGRYLSSDEPMRVFAAGSVNNRLNIEVVWPGGGRTVVPEAVPNSVYEIAQFKSEPRNAPAPVVQGKPLFEDAAARLNHTHTEEPFDDFARQPTLPNKLSQPGPGIAWCDMNGDGLEDLVVGGGRGAGIALLVNDGKGGFFRLEDPNLCTALTRDQTAMVAWRRAPGDTAMLVALANYEDGIAAGTGIRQLNFKTKSAADVLTAPESTIGPMALADVDGDGDLDLFVGGRVLPGRYPEPASSMVLRQEGGSWKVDPGSSKVLDSVGLVSGAVFTDIDGDGDPDLVLACEWGSIRVFRNHGGKLQDDSEALGLSKLKGWWTSVAAGDFDGDGRMDLVGGNWGRNTRYERFRTQPLRLYYGSIPFSEPGTLIEACFEPGMGKYVPQHGMDFMSRVCPWLKEKFGTHEAYAKAGVEDIWGPELQKCRVLEANCLETMLFLNRGTHFEARQLPLQAQLAPVFGIAVGDLDGDGAEDIFLAQNFFATQPETPRYDAGVGLILKGDGKGNFAPLSPQQSGISIYGEQRGAGLADYDGDGRLDLAVGQNGGQTRLFHNALGKPGVRVHLEGPPGNLSAIGAQLRVVSTQKSSAIREIHGGGGYLSQDGTVQVLQRPSSDAQLLIRWPGGKEARLEVPVNAREIKVDHAGKLTVVR